MVSDREKTINENIGLVHSIANRFRNRGAEYDDLFQAGCLGLVKAVDNFDESRGFAFSTYAVPVIMGEIKRIFRDGTAVRISRSLKEKANAVQAVRDAFIKRELREPTINELSALTKFDVEELSEIINVINPVVSLSAYVEEENAELDIPCNEDEENLDRLCIRQLLSKLNEHDRTLIRYRYFQGKTQSETAKLLGVSQVQISRKEKAILKKLRELL